MKINQIFTVTLGAGLCALATGAASAAAPATQASDFPNRPIRFIVGFPPGGGNDAMARMVSTRLAERVGQSVVIDNRPGAGGNVAAEVVSKAESDGHTILMISSSHPIQGLIKKGLRYDPINDFSGISQLANYRSVLVAHPTGPANVKDLVAAVKAKPGQFNFVSAGAGSGSHLAGEMFRYYAGVDMVHVSYKGTAQALTDLISGRVQLMFTPLVPMMPHVQAGRLRALAVTSKNRSRIMPDLPTIAEAGVTGYEFGAWYGIVGPARIPADIVKRLNGEIARVMQDREVRERLSAEDMDPSDATPAQFDEARRLELSKWAKIVTQLKLQFE
jgi:tripartite-type tricarboxylate transporter receptor subunit TctC